MDFSGSRNSDIDLVIEYILNNFEVLPNKSEVLPENNRASVLRTEARIKAEKTSEDKMDRKQQRGYMVQLPPGYDVVRIRDLSRFSPSIPVERMPQHILGNGVLGRCYPALGVIQIRDDLYGRDFEEVDVHELKHAISPHMSEYQVRFWTRAMFDYTRYN